MAIANTSDWNITTDIYGIEDSLNNIKKRYVEDEDETTLSLGIFGYVTDTEAKKIQTSVITTGELGNEMFPTRAKLSKNVLAHSIYCNIEDINAIPSNMVLNLGIRVTDFNKYIQGNRFIFDCEYPIFIGNYEFHFDYDIILIRSETSNGKYVYSAHYDMSEENRLSDIRDAYLKQPFVLKISNVEYIVLQCLIRQFTIEETRDRIYKESIIDNKTYTFEFENQIADFDVYITENEKTTRLKPIPYGEPTEETKNYCWYLFITDNTIRITFDNKSYIPGLNAEILIKAYTTLGAKGNFNYKKIDEANDGFFTELESDKYNYERIVCYAVPTTDPVNGRDRRTTKQLRNLIPKAALSRGSITSETDVNNYFNIIQDETNILKMQKKEDNQVNRIWYGYFLLKDMDNNIIPTNTTTIEINTSDGSTVTGEDRREILPAGTIFRYDPETRLAKVYNEADIPPVYSEEYFNDKYYYYMSVYNIIINPDPLYAAFYLSISNTNGFFSFEAVNENVDMQFIATRCNFQRGLLLDQQIYKFTFSIAQSANADIGLYVKEMIDQFNPITNKIEKVPMITNNMKCILVLYNGNVPYRWTEATLTDYDFTRYRSSWSIEMETDNGMDNKNRIKINDLHVAGSSDYINYGYFEPNTKAVLYILAKFADGEFGREDLDEIAPGYDGWSVTNKYEVNSGLNFYENFTEVLFSKISLNENTDNVYQVTGVPLVGLHYMTDVKKSDYLIQVIDEKKAYIDYCLRLLENSMDVDFKFFNTYGPSFMYTIGDKKNTSIGHVDIELKFRASLKATADMYTKDELKVAIKEYFENLYRDHDWHYPNMIDDIYNKYQFKERLNYLEYMNFNNFWLGIQHITQIKVDDLTIVPEFINIRNRYNINGELEPCIDIEINY